MRVPLELLLALKATQLGIAAAGSPHRALARRMLDAAVEQLGGTESPEERLRFFFYLGARAALDREAGGDPVNDRVTLQAARTEAARVFYDWFMRVQNATERTVGIGSFGSTSPAGHPYDSPFGRVKWALKEKLMPEARMTQSDVNFLADVSLAALLQKHGIRFEG